ncbi:MAG: hypothetical protein JO265_09215 [Acidimicrobiia bacterium]|nr:hypothetical protein [Acidimicrobiia bacterium]
MRVLAVAPVPDDGPATRFRVTQLQEPLRARGIEVELSPFLDAGTFRTLYDRSAWPRTTAGVAAAVARRVADTWRARRFDCLFVQREAMLLGPPLVERLVSRLGRVPIVLDLDDATYVEGDSPTYGRVGRWLKWPGKTDALIDMADAVTCGSRAIAEYATARGASATVVPTVVDPRVFAPRPAERSNPLPVLGWVGSHSTFPFLDALAPVLRDVASEHRFRLLVVGSGRPHVAIAGVDVDHRPWRREREVRDFQELDIGL